MSSPPPHNPLLNMQLGYALLRDRRVPIRTKLIALGIGAAAIGAIEMLQLPVEGIIAVLLPFVGAAGDLVMDSAEAVIGPVLIATILLPISRPPTSSGRSAPNAHGVPERRIPGLSIYHRGMV